MKMKVWNDPSDSGMARNNRFCRTLGNRAARARRRTRLLV